MSVYPGSVEKIYELKKVFPIINGSAQLTFDSIPSFPTIVKLQIQGGKINQYSELWGAQDLVPGSNLVEVAGKGSGLQPDILANSAESIVSKKATSIPGSNFITKISESYSTVKSLNISEPEKIVNNVVSVYQAKLIENPEEISLISSSVAEFLTTSKASQDAFSAQSSSIRGNTLRAGVYSWTWDTQYNWWSYYFPGSYTNTGALRVWAFQDTFGNNYPYLGYSTLIDKLFVGSSTNFYLSTTLINVSEVYFFTLPTNNKCYISGQSTAKADGYDFFTMKLQNLECDVNGSYPAAGLLGFAFRGVYDGLVVIVSFNGTCVADVTITTASGVEKKGKLLLI